MRSTTWLMCAASLLAPVLTSPVADSVARSVDVSAAPCEIAGRNSMLDLSTLARHQADYTVPSTEYPAYEWGVNICRQTTTPPSSICGSDTAVCERHRLTKVAVDNYGNFDKVGLLWANGVVVMNMSGTACVSDPSKRLQSTILFTCDRQAAEPKLAIKTESFYGCFVEFTMRTKLVCDAAPAPGPPGPAKYTCAEDRCSQSAVGTQTKEECETTCGMPPPPPPPATKYKCEQDRCSIAATGGVAKEECEAVCEGPPPPPPPPVTKYKCEQDRCSIATTGGVAKEECEAVCEGPPPPPPPPPSATKYKCVADKCVEDESGGVPLETCQAVCN